MLTAQSKQLELENTAREDHTLLWIAAPVTCPEISDTEIPMSSAAGVDGVSARQWRSVPVRIRALFYNIVLAVGEFPPELLLSRTIFVPKKDGSSTPAEFRPISVASVIVRQLHKIFAVRLVKANLIDERQRALHDGCVENTVFLDTALHVARGSLKELHAVSLDVSKAFDSVSHYAIRSALRGRGLPEALVQYMVRMYENSGTVLEVGRVRSSPIRVTRGVRQGDPLSSLLFSMVIDDVMRALLDHIGFAAKSIKTNALAYADDLVLFASSKSGMKSLLRIAEEEAAKSGLSFNPSKSQAISIMIAGKVKKYKVLTEPQFTLNSGPINQLGSTEAFRYLGLSISPRGIAKPTGYIMSELARITTAPLRPQQRLKILRCFLIPRLYHQLVLSRTTMRVLKAMDKQVRVAVRTWLYLPKDTPLGYFHASCIDGGLGIPAFETTVPGLIFERFASLTESTSPVIRDVVDHPYNVSLIRWARAMLTRNGKALLRKEDRQRHWATRLHRSNDGAELREAAAVPASSRWVDAGSYGIPGRDYVAYHRVRINALPTRVRTTQGRNDREASMMCRAGCNVTETAAHVVQSCHRTHGGRVLRHDAICRIAASGLRKAGWRVIEAPHYRLATGLQKPDMVICKGSDARIIDAQVVSGASSLDDSHLRKCAKYDTTLLKSRVAGELGVVASNVTVTSITLSWKGVWSRASAASLISLGIGNLLPSLTTRVLQGSHTNWTRWNKMTTTISHRVERVGVG
uniref:Reverse transcriptase domain-containing protein n=1 Tax=Trichogramma kaykai TaxID=54128 RepID=A0ABD2XNC2_9HYME